MALLPLYWDVVNKRFVFSETNPRHFMLPELHQEDSITIEFRALKKIREAMLPFFEVVTLSGYDLLLSVGSAASILASAGSWVPSSDNKTLSGTLDLNTAGINALADGTAQIFEVRLFDGTNYYRGQTSCTIRKSVATTGTLQAVVNDIALGKREASRTYVKKEMAAGEGILWQSASGRKWIEYMHDDGSKRVEEVT